MTTRAKRYGDEWVPLNPEIIYDNLNRNHDDEQLHSLLLLYSFQSSLSADDRVVKEQAERILAERS